MLVGHQPRNTRAWQRWRVLLLCMSNYKFGVAISKGRAVAEMLLLRLRASYVLLVVPHPNVIAAGSKVCAPGAASFCIRESDERNWCTCL